MNDSIKYEIDLNKIRISLDETHHVYHGNPLYENRFKSVMSFHLPGIAAVMDDTGGYHINLQGVAIYDKRFYKSFGYYDDIAAVSDESGWYHINLKGYSIYSERYGWVGNFQDERCPIRNKEGSYFHITKKGLPAYEKKYRYVGDFKYGIAVIYDEDGFAKHIDKKGNLIHHHNYEELGVFHKGFATARDSCGAFHIDKYGKPLYETRYQWVEPFYNGFALVCRQNGEKLIINENGDFIHQIYDENTGPIRKNLRKKLMAMLVGYWNTQIIHSIVKFEVLDKIISGYDTFQALLDNLKMPEYSLDMIIKVSKLWNLISERNGHYILKYLGCILTENHPETLKYAALMWGDEHYIVMSKLFDALKNYTPQFHKIYGLDVFHYFNQNKERGIIFNKAMKEYSSDYDKMISLYDFSNSKTVMDIGGGSGYILENILEKNRNIEKVILFDLPSVIENTQNSFKNTNVKSKMKYIAGDFFDDISQQADTIILSRILHDWNDDNACKILKNIKKSLTKGGKLLLFETIVPDSFDTDIGITLNFNLLVCAGGKERTMQEFQNLLKKVNLEIIEVKKTSGIISLIIAH